MNWNLATYLPEAGACQKNFFTVIVGEYIWPSILLGLKTRTQNTERHPNTEHFKSRISNGSFVHIMNVTEGLDFEM